MDPDLFHTCSMCSRRAFYECFFGGRGGSLEIWDPLRPKYPKIYKNPNIWRNKKQKQKKLFVKRSAGAPKTRVQFFRVYPSKTAWTLDSEGIWGFMLEPACTLVDLGFFEISVLKFGCIIFWILWIILFWNLRN